MNACSGNLANLHCPNAQIPGQIGASAWHTHAVTSQTQLTEQQDRHGSNGVATRKSIESSLTSLQLLPSRAREVGELSGVTDHVTVKRCILVVEIKRR